MHFYQRGFSLSIFFLYHQKARLSKNLVEIGRKAGRKSPFLPGTVQKGLSLCGDHLQEDLLAGGGRGPQYGRFPLLLFAGGQGHVS